jgi:hypothetical protein
MSAPTTTPTAPSTPPKQPSEKVSDRDRLLAALQTAPRLTKDDAEYLNRTVQEAREASIADNVPA